MFKILCYLFSLLRLMFVHNFHNSMSRTSMLSKRQKWYLKALQFFRTIAVVGETSGRKQYEIPAFFINDFVKNQLSFLSHVLKNGFSTNASTFAYTLLNCALVFNKILDTHKQAGNSLNLLRFRSNFGKPSIFYQGIKIYNKLPRILINKKLKFIFKIELKKVLYINNQIIFL